MSNDELRALDVDRGPAPGKDEGVALIEAAVRSGLKDPDSAKFEWPHGFTSGWYRLPFGPRRDGWITCGTINAKNSYGGYVGRAAVIGAIRNGVVVGTDLDNASARYSSSVAEICRTHGMPVP